MIFYVKEISRKLIAGETLTEGTFINRLHYSIGCDQVHRLAVPDHKRCVAEFIDHTGSKFHDHTS